MDLSVFQFDYSLTWGVMFLNADRTIYGRYGVRSSRKDATKDVSLEGFKEALRGALELHAAYPGNRKDLEGKTGEKPLWKTPEAIPDNRNRPNVKPADGSRGGCVHCHQAHDGELWTLRAGGRPITDLLLWPYPMPDLLGFSLDPASRATVSSVADGSPAALSGLRAGDGIVRLGGQAVISIADVLWVLHHAKDPGKLKVELARGDEKVPAELALPEGWRRKGDFTWREYTWGLRHRLLGTQPLEAVSADDRKKLKIRDGAMAFRVKGFPPDWVKDKNPSAPAAFKEGDVIVAVDGRSDLASEALLLAYLIQEKAPGQAAEFVVLRGGKAEKAPLKIP